MSDESKPKLTSARWVGGYEAVLADGTILVPNETVVKVPVGEAENSDNWEPTRAKPTPAAKEGDE